MNLQNTHTHFSKSLVITHESIFIFKHNIEQLENPHFENFLTNNKSVLYLVALCFSHYRSILNTTCQIKSAELRILFIYLFVVLLLKTKQQQKWFFGKVWDLSGMSMVVTLNGHYDTITSLISLPPCLIASGSADSNAILWYGNGTQAATLAAHMATITSFAILPDYMVATGSADMNIDAWNYCGCSGNLTNPLLGDYAKGLQDSIGSLIPTTTTAGPQPTTSFVSVPATTTSPATTTPYTCSLSALLYTLSVHYGPVNSLVYLASNNRLVSASSDHTLAMFAPDTGALIGKLFGHTGQVLDVHALTTPNVVASASSDKSVRVWNTTTGSQIVALNGHTAQVYVLAPLPNGQLVSGSNDRTAIIWDTVAQKLLFTLAGHTGTVTTLLYLADGYVVTGSMDWTIKVWNASSGALLNTLTNHTNIINCLVALSSSTFASGSADTNIYVWNAKTGVAVCLFLSSFCFFIVV